MKAPTHTEAFSEETENQRTGALCIDTDVNQGRRPGKSRHAGL